MKSTRYSKLFLFAVLSILLFLAAPALAQDASAIPDTAESWDEETAVRILFDRDTVDVRGDGAMLSNGILTIDKAGTYVLAGTWAGGQVCIDAGKKDVVRLIFNGVSIHCPDSAPLYAIKAGKVILTLAKDTQNALSDGGAYTYPGEEPDAALYVQDSLLINGRGSLAVTASFMHGIVAKDDLLIEGGILSVTAAGVGIRGRDTLTISGGDITVTAMGDALQANNGDDPEKGRILLTGGTCHLTSLKDGIQAESSLTISGGDYTLYTGGVTADSGEEALENRSTGGSSADAAGKGMKAGGDIVLSGGTFALYCADDAINAKGSVTLMDGSFKINTGDDAIRADRSVTIAGGSLTVTKCYEGIESAAIFISGGTVDVDAANDGFNTSGSGGDGLEDLVAPDGTLIRITGGDVTIKALGNGIDTSGNVTLEGGTLTVGSSFGSSKSTLDLDGALTVSGGTLHVSGGANMVRMSGFDSSQPALMVCFSTPIKGGSRIAMTAAGGETVYSCVPANDFQTILLCAPGLCREESYALTVNGEALFTAALHGAFTVLSGDGSQVEGEMPNTAISGR